MIKTNKHKIILAKIMCFVILLNIGFCAANLVLEKTNKKEAWAIEKREKQIEYDTTHTQKFIVYGVKKNKDLTYSFSYMNGETGCCQFESFDPLDKHKNVYPGTFDTLIVKQLPFNRCEYSLFLKTP